MSNNAPHSCEPSHVVCFISTFSYTRLMVSSSVCHHSFSAEAIKAMFMGGHGAKKCPAAGCTKAFSLSDCKPNKDLVKKVKAFERRQKRREEEMDDGEVIE